jgi:hypothetical protein
VAWDELAYVTTDTDVNVASTATAVVLTSTVTFPEATTAVLSAEFPAFEFTGSNGGDAQIELAYGTPETIAIFGRVSIGRSISWPVLLNRRVSVPAGDVSFTLQVDSISGAVVCHADPATYGPISMQIQVETAGGGSGRLAVVRTHTDQHIAIDPRCSVVNSILAEPGNLFTTITGPDDTWAGAPDDGKGLYS